VVFNRSDAGTAVALVPSPRLAPDRLAVVRPSAASARTDWSRRIVFRLVVLETLAAAVTGAVVIATRAEAVPVGSLLFGGSLALVAAWPAVLALAGAYSSRIFGTGSDEYRRVGRAALVLLALVGFMSYSTSLDLSRALVVAGVPALAAATLVGRYVARRRLRRLWSLGRCVRRVVIVGRGGAVLELAAQLHRQRFAGLHVVAACVTAADISRVTEACDVPVAGLGDVLDVARRYSADTVAVTTASETAAEYLRGLSWQLEGTGVELLVAPGLIEVAGPRLHIRPFEGLPLLAVEQPRFEGWPRVVKGALDRAVAAVAIVLFAPALLAVAVAVRMSGPGPILYRQERIGHGGRPFRMLKFRSMVADADRQLDRLRDANVSDGLLFKIREDPRVTPVGRWLRRYSVDELPQLFNVLCGSMSLVGPRPPLPAEVARYDSSVSRRLLVKPGLTGLWQISGRSDLPWEETVRLDLRYVENWSLALDALILWKTGRAVLAGSGAY
jgi:exopolysaccharide biosynthesis polyprenyl glycosylphosphotransferase